MPAEVLRPARRRPDLDERQLLRPAGRAERLELADAVPGNHLLGAGPRLRSRREAHPALQAVTRPERLGLQRPAGPHERAVFLLLLPLRQHGAASFRPLSSLRWPTGCCSVKRARGTREGDGLGRTSCISHLLCSAQQDLKIAIRCLLLGQNGQGAPSSSAGRSSSTGTAAGGRGPEQKHAHECMPSEMFPGGKRRAINGNITCMNENTGQSSHGAD